MDFFFALARRFIALIKTARDKTGSSSKVGEANLYFCPQQKLYEYTKDSVKRCASSVKLYLRYGRHRCGTKNLSKAKSYTPEEGQKNNKKERSETT